MLFSPWAPRALIWFESVRYSPTLSVVDDSNIQADLLMPANASAEELHAATDAVVAAARELDSEIDGNAVAGILVTTGMRIPLESYEGADFGTCRGNVASVQLKLNPASMRDASVEELRFRWQTKLAGATRADSIAFPTRRSRPTEQVSYALIHADHDVLRDAAAELEAAWSELPGVLNVEGSMAADSRRIDVRLNDAGHAAGLSTAAVATQLRNSFYGAEAQRIQRGREEVLVMVRYPRERRASYAELLNERIDLPNTRRQVPLYTIAEVRETETPSARLRVDGQNAAVVTARLDIDASLSGDVAERSAAEILPALQDRHPNLQIREHGMSRELRKVGDTLLVSTPIALFFVYCLIASLLRSFIQPLLALAGVPMAFVGAVAGHWLLGYELTVTSIFGLIAALLLGFGLFALFNVTIERYPALDLRTVIVTVPCDGATPREVEEDIVVRIEESLVGIDGVDRITSNAWEGLGQVVIEFVQWQDMTARLDEVRTAVESIEDFPPAGADEPEIVEQEVMRGVVSLFLSSRAATEQELRLAADELREELLLLPGVTVVDLFGAREREIQIELDESRLRSYRLTVEEVVSRVQSSSLNLSGGALRTDSGNLVLSALEKRYTAEEFSDIVIIAETDGSIVRLDDIAVLRDGFVEDPLLNTIDAAAAVFIEISAPDGINPQDVRRQVENRLAAYDLPSEMQLDIWMDYVHKATQPLSSIAGSAIVGVALVFAVLVLLLELRIAIWVALGIPTAIIGAFIVLFAMGQTLHVMSVLGFAIVIGIVVEEANTIIGGTAVNAINVMVGQHKPLETVVGTATTAPAPNLASVQLRLNTVPQREISVAELRNVWLESIGTIPGAERLAFPQAIGYASAGIGLVLQHPDTEQLLAAATELKRRLREHDPVYEIADTLDLNKRRYEMELTDLGTAAGLTPALLAAQLRNRFFGAEAQRIVRNQDELKVMARYPIGNRLLPVDLQDEYINLPGGGLAAFPDLARVEETRELAQRQRVDGLPAASITANFNVAATSSGEMGGLIFGQWLPELRETYPGLRDLPSGSSRDTQKILDMLSVTFPAALLLMFALISMQLRSVLQPLYILVSIPLTVAGVFYMHILLGYDFSLSSIFGTVAVTGIVVNDAPVFLDMYNKTRREDPGMSVENAILRAARLRARPILITTVTTIVGLMPLLYNRSESIEPFLSSIVSLAGGLLFAGVSLLLLTPAVMALFEKRPAAPLVGSALRG